MENAVGNMIIVKERKHLSFIDISCISLGMNNPVSVMKNAGRTFFLSGIGSSFRRIHAELRQAYLLNDLISRLYSDFIISLKTLYFRLSSIIFTPVSDLRKR